MTTGAGRGSGIKEFRYERATGPATLKAHENLRRWLRACARYRSDLMRGNIRPDAEGKYPSGPVAADYDA